MLQTPWARGSTFESQKHQKVFSRSHLSRMSDKRPRVITVKRKLLNLPFGYTLFNFDSKRRKFTHFSLLLRLSLKISTRKPGFKAPEKKSHRRYSPFLSYSAETLLMLFKLERLQPGSCLTTRMCNTVFWHRKEKSLKNTGRSRDIVFLSISSLLLHYHKLTLLATDREKKEKLVNAQKWGTNTDTQLQFRFEKIQETVLEKKLWE